MDQHVLQGNQRLVPRQGGGRCLTGERTKDCGCYGEARVARAHVSATLKRVEELLKGALVLRIPRSRERGLADTRFPYLPPSRAIP